MSEQKIQDENSVGTEQNSMVQRIALEVKRRNPNSINELVLDNCARCHSIQGLTEDFCNLRILSIINVGLQSLAKFPALSKLRKLYLSDNRLSSGLENLEGCPNLTVLVLAGNKFKSIDELKPLVKLSKLSVLDLMNCEVTSTDGYRETIFNMLPQLKYLDNTDKDGVEKDSDDEDEDDDEENETGENNEEDDEEDEDEYEEDDHKTGLQALYNGTFEEGDDDEESYEGNEDDEEESDEDDDLSEGDVSADPIEETAKGEKRKRDNENQQGNDDDDVVDDDGPPHKI